MDKKNFHRTNFHRVKRLIKIILQSTTALSQININNKNIHKKITKKQKSKKHKISPIIFKSET